MSVRHWRRAALALVLYGGVFALAVTVGGLGYFHFGNPRDTCASCHEMTGGYSNWLVSSHRTVHCRDCHGGSLTLEVHALEAHGRRLVRHLTDAPELPPRLLEKHVAGLHEACRKCHPQAFSGWQAGRHSTTYARIFLDAETNRRGPPANDCLRCHGMFFQGDIADLVVPAGAPGAWTLKDPAKATQPAVPCLACHQVHAPADSTQRASLFDHRERAHYSAHRLPTAAVYQGERAVRISRDPRQRVCVQCHAPDATHQLATSDDRTPAGVHEGLSCLDCHWSHDNSAKSSCNACHPADSNCGLDVQKMDTTFLSAESRHNVHTVACVDCHPQGAPPGGKGRNPAARP